MVGNPEQLGLRWVLGVSAIQRASGEGACREEGARAARPAAPHFGGSQGPALQGRDATGYEGAADRGWYVPTIEFIKRQAAAKKPFFVYLGYSEMHPPVVCNPEFVNKSPQMDYRVGPVLDGIKEAGVDDNTIVVLSSDNGFTTGAASGSGGSSGPWRGNFYNTPFEGSMRVPCIVRWPGKVPAGVVTQQMLAAVDWLPTFAGLAGASNLVPKDRPIDGKDTSAFLLGKSPTTGRDFYVFFGADGELMSIKWQHYKWIFRYTPGPAAEAVKRGYEAPPLPMVFDLSSDPHEDYNLWNATMTMGWTYGPISEIIAAYEESVKNYPNIKPGEDFKGYEKR
jgi:arylsulfatase